MARKLEVQIAGDSSGLARAFKSATDHSSHFGSALATLGKTAALAAGAAGIGAIAVGLKAGISEYLQASAVAAQTNAVIKSTGGVANVSAKQVDTLATALMRKSGVDDEVIKSGENVLLAFTHIHNEVGKGNDIFNRATAAVLDFSVRTGRDMPQAALALGKALEDPATKLAGLSKAGIIFSESQKKMVADMVKSGHTMDAQKFILAELEKRYGGAAEAAGKTLPGQLKILREEFNNFAGDLVARAVPALLSFTGFLKNVAAAKGFHAKIDVAIGAVTNIAERAAAIGLELGSRIKDTLVGTDWGDVGAKIGASISQAIKVTTGFMDSALSAAVSWVSGHAGELGQVGALMMLSIVAALTDPVFWAQHWQLALGVALLAIGGPAGKLAEKAGSLIVKELGDTVVRLAPEFALKLFFVVDAAIRQLARLGVALDLVMTAILITGIRAIVNATSGFFSAALALGQRAVAGVQSGLARLVDTVSDKFHALIGSVKGFALDAFSAAVSVGRSLAEGVWAGMDALFGWVVGKVTGFIHGVVHAIKVAAGISSPSELFAQEIGHPLALGIIKGFTDGLRHDYLLGPLKAAKQSIDDFVGGEGVANMTRQGSLLREALQTAWAGTSLRTTPLVAGTSWMPTVPGPISEPPIRSMSPDGAIVLPLIVNLDGKTIARVVTTHQIADSFTKTSIFGGRA